MSTETSKPVYAFKYWISFEVRNTTNDRSRRFNTTLFLSRKPKQDEDIQNVQELLKQKVLNTNIPGFSLDMATTQITLLSWPHFIEKVDVAKLPTAQPSPKPAPVIEPPKVQLKVLKGGLR